MATTAAGSNQEQHGIEVIAENITMRLNIRFLNVIFITRVELLTYCTKSSSELS